ncbi:chemotaxis protein CheW [Vibrio sp. TBV020]|uniref:chemotaxis protein CheW n=1 Tax=Vibrio sp. TBV020 TaxID=3137398 RepID=UPI0038CD72A4
MNDAIDVESAPAIEVLLVEVSSEVVAIPIDSVKEVIEYTQITQVPMCHKEVSGVINVRGSVVPVVDAAIRLGTMAHQTYDKYSCIILYESLSDKLQESVMIGLVVSRVRSIKSISLDRVFEKPAFGVHIPNQYVADMVEVDNETIPLLIMAELLNGKQINQGLLKHQQMMLSRWES